MTDDTKTPPDDDSLLEGWTVTSIKIDGIEMLNPNGPPALASLFTHDSQWVEGTDPDTGEKTASFVGPAWGTARTVEVEVTGGEELVGLALIVHEHDNTRRTYGVNPFASDAGPRTIELTKPGNASLFLFSIRKPRFGYYDTACPDEGTVGPFDSEEAARTHARTAYSEEGAYKVLQLTDEQCAALTEDPLSVEFQAFKAGETPEIKATIMADSHEDYVAMRDAVCDPGPPPLGYTREGESEETYFKAEAFDNPQRVFQIAAHGTIRFRDVERRVSVGDELGVVIAPEHGIETVTINGTRIDEIPTDA